MADTQSGENQSENSAHQELPQKDQTQIRELPMLMLKGFAMGSADVVPGVSGGTLALITGIYSRLIDAIKSVDLTVLRALFRLQLREVFERVHWLFLLGLLTGVMGAILFFTRVIRLPELMFIHPEPIYGLFFGLIVGSVWLIGRDLGGITLGRALWIIAGVVIGLRIVTLVPVDTPETGLFVFMSGALAITAMILPGISGSFILLILRKYDYILMQFGKLGGPDTTEALLVLIPFGLGMIIGIMVFSRMLSWLLQRYYVKTLCVLIGFMIGSLFVIWPFQEREYAESVRPEVVAMSDAMVRDLVESPESPVQPEYRRLGDRIEPGETYTMPDGSDISVEEPSVVVERVKNKLIGSAPFVPSWSGAGGDVRLRSGRASVGWAFGMMLTGFGLMVVIGRIAGKKTE